MTGRNLAYRLANKLFTHWYPLYFPLYSQWKALADRRERSFLDNLMRPGMSVVDVGANVGVYTRFFQGGWEILERSTHSNPDRSTILVLEQRPAISTM